MVLEERSPMVHSLDFLDESYMVDLFLGIRSGPTAPRSQSLNAHLDGWLS